MTQRDDEGEAIDLSEIKRNARDRQSGCYWHAYRYRLSARRWEHVGMAVSLVAGTATLLAGAALLTDHKDTSWVATVLGILAIVAGFAQLLDRSIGPEKRAADFRKGEIGYNKMSMDYLVFAQTWSDSTTAAAEYRRLREKDKGLSELPRGVEAWTQARVDAKRKRD